MWLKLYKYEYSGVYWDVIGVPGAIKQCRMCCGGGERKRVEEGDITALPAVCLYATPCLVPWHPSSLA